MNYIMLYITFFKVGLFTIGGGLAALPLIQQEVIRNGWMTMGTFSDMIAVSQSTPGPIGVNMATYVGFHEMGFIGSIIATIGLVTPSVIIICVIASFLDHFNEHPIVKAAFYGLRPAVIALIVSAAWSILQITVFAGSDFGFPLNLRALILFAVLFYSTNKYKHHPVVYILLAGATGIVIF